MPGATHACWHVSLHTHKQTQLMEAQFTCFTSTKVQVLTAAELPGATLALVLQFTFFTSTKVQVLTAAELPGATLVCWPVALRTHKTSLMEAQQTPGKRRAQSSNKLLEEWVEPVLSLLGLPVQEYKY